MFIDEAKLAVQLNHPASARWSVGKVGDSYFIAMGRPGARPQAAVLRCKTQLPDGTPTMPLAPELFCCNEVVRGAHLRAQQAGLSLGNPLSGRASRCLAAERCWSATRGEESS